MIRATRKSMAYYRWQVMRMFPLRLEGPCSLGFTRLTISDMRSIICTQVDPNIGSLVHPFRGDRSNYLRYESWARERR